jgi:hypothetical protein
MVGIDIDNFLKSEGSIIQKKLMISNGKKHLIALNLN